MLGWEIVTLFVGMMVTCLILATGHWFPWATKLTRVQAYTFGVAAILVGFSLWRGMNGDWSTPLGAWVISGTGWPCGSRAVAWAGV